MIFVSILFPPFSSIIVGYLVRDGEIVPKSQRLRNVSRRELIGATGRGLLGAGLLGVMPGLAARPVSAQQSFPLVSVSAGTNDDTPETILKTALEGLGGIGRF